MKKTDIGLIAILGVIGYFIFKHFSDSGSTAFLSGSGIGGVLPGSTIPQYEIPPQTYYQESVSGYYTPKQYTVTHGKTTTTVRRTGGRSYTFQSSNPASNKTGLITVGTPSEQIEQFSTAPKVIVEGGKYKKVM